MKYRYWLTAAVVAAIIMGGIAVVSVPVPSFESVKSAPASSEAILLDRHGVVLERMRLDKTRRMLAWVTLEEVSPAFQQAILAAEDKRFYYHVGVDPLAVISATLENIRRPRARGASTITMQLAKLLQAPARQNTWLEKFAQVRSALALELHWSKRQILEAYLNRVPFRYDLVGVDAAARGLLAKGPGGLNQADAAVLASLVRAPGASRSTVARRACATLQAASKRARGENEALSCESTALLASMLPARPLPIAGVDDAPHLARRLLQKPGEQLRVAVDAGLQHFVIDVLRTHLSQLTEQNVEDGAVLVLDNKTGEVLAYVGSSGDFSGAPEVDGVVALRQPGSTLKPFLYAAAMDQGWLNASSVLDDSPLALTTPSGLYIPQDYDRHFRGAVSVRTALGSSLNVPAVRTLTLVGVDRFLNVLRQFGLVSLGKEADYYGFGLALGAGETSLMQLTNAYRALANRGRWSPARFLLEQDSGQDVVTDREPVQVLSEQASFIIADILADPAARVLTFGLASPLSTHTWAAVKTGTSKGMRDNWAVGFTDRYTVGVWVGNFSGEPMWDVSGVTGAAPVWRDVVQYLHQDIPAQAPLPPAGVLQQQISYQPAIESARHDWVIVHADDQPPADVVIKVTPSSPMLIAPPDSAVIAPDPDIPQQRQALMLQSSGAGKTCMLLDDRPVSACGKTRVLVPLPLPGHHVLTLKDESGKVLDKHQFEVRAMYVP
ncbi:penicillin-binding protein 1C [Methylobacillus rhizosphaerae]|uniref:peptidoglycan glycosyltransferase n=1 Tax=Methylobacillus rhizosphaerae TaxID=551994 RepID=A0A238ZY90_9PROT|nr:penicillin-binding protein 1C [Methylobacillus rhizosphaerae]SNR88355.1 penicillin-binding protein 1C [Methylobacillus rhizosphaerae]